MWLFQPAICLPSLGTPMLRIFPSLVIALACGILPSASRNDVALPRVSGLAYLNNSHAIESLRQSNPNHYAKIHQIAAIDFSNPYAADPEKIRAQFNARDVLYSTVIVASLPAKKNISFKLDDVQYEITVTVQ